MTTIAHQLQLVHPRMAQACVQAARPAHSVALLAVSKTFPAQAVLEAAQAGQRAFGENYLQEGVDKIASVQALAPALAAQLQWHCIGPIQSNKTRLVAEHFHWAHTIDRLKIAQRLSEQRPAHLPPLQVCLQLNVDGGANKAGVPPEEARALALAVAPLPRLQLRGVMSIPEPAADFATQRALHLRAQAVWADIAALAQEGSTPQAVKSGLAQWDTLSLGMTADLEAAIAAGSTLVRVGSGIFGARAARA